MVSKILTGMLLFSTMAFSQIYHIDCKTDSLVGVLASKDAKIASLHKSIKMTRKLNKSLLDSLMISKMDVDSLYRFKLYYEHSKHLLSARLIGRIEEMVDANE